MYKILNIFMILSPILVCTSCNGILGQSTNSTFVQQVNTENILYNKQIEQQNLRLIGTVYNYNLEDISIKIRVTSLRANSFYVDYIVLLNKPQFSHDSNVFLRIVDKERFELTKRNIACCKEEYVGEIKGSFWISAETLHKMEGAELCFTVCESKDSNKVNIVNIVSDIN